MTPSRTAWTRRERPTTTCSAARASRYTVLPAGAGGSVHPKVAGNNKGHTEGGNVKHHESKHFTDNEGDRAHFARDKVDHIER